MTERKPIKAIFIDAVNKQVREIKLEEGGAYKEMFRVLSVPGLRPCDDINTIRLDHAIHYIFVDGEGILKDSRQFFLWKGYDNALAGNGIIHRVDPDSGESVDVELSVTQVARHVTFAELQSHGVVQVTKSGEVYGKPGVIIQNRAVITEPGGDVEAEKQRIADELGVPVESLKWTKLEREQDQDPSEPPLEGETGNEQPPV